MELDVLNYERVLSQIRPSGANNRSFFIRHFNDVYNIESSEDDDIAGGLSRFVNALELLSLKFKGITVFSGDILSPSTISTMTKGQQMIDSIPMMSIDVACVGNHDFDFGIERLEDLVKANPRTSWLLSNLKNYETGDSLSFLKESLIQNIHGITVAFIAVVESEWIDTLGAVDRDDFLYIDFIEHSRNLAESLRSQGAEIIIAVTHMRLSNDQLLFNSVKSIDIILGGHDHVYYLEDDVDGRILIKSGTDFRDLSLIQVDMTDGTLRFNIDHIRITRDIPENVKCKELVDSFKCSMESAMERNLGNMEVELDGRFEIIRTQESNLGICRWIDFLS
ncbi:hypothetical protein GJ496_010864 [Pomphorhynchus laevis]|nr:hypothetical protein GJ496_010864 [Pomphorhynchus laevis]